MPTVTVLLPVYNGGQFIAEAVDSVLGQTFTDWQLLIVDDGSNDATPSILQRYSSELRIRIHRQNHLGLVAALNAGLAQAQGDFLARLDADDRMHPNRLERQVDALLRHSQWGICGSAFRVIDHAGMTVRTDRMPIDDVAIRWHSLFNTPFAHPTVMLRLAIFKQNDLRYNPEAKLVEDYDLWLRLLQAYPGANLPEVLLDYRQHAGSVSHKDHDVQARGATRLAQRAQNALGVSLNEAEVAELRRWYHRFPRRLTLAQAFLAQALWRLLDAFSLSPVREGDLQALRGRWLARLLLTPAEGLDRRAWRSSLSLADWFSIAHHMQKRLLHIQ